MDPARGQAMPCPTSRSPRPPRSWSLLLLLGLVAGCAGVRTPVRDATYGVFDAIQNPPPGDQLARDLRRLVQVYVERALKAGPPEDLGKMAGRISTEVLKSTAATAMEQRKLVGVMVSEALRSGITTLDHELPALERASATGSRLVSDAMKSSLAQLEQQADGAGEGPLAHAVLEMAQRTAGATVRGATEGLRAEMVADQGAGTAHGGDAVQSFSRSMVAGAIQGLRQELGIWLLMVAFGLGLLAAGTTMAIVHVARRRGE
jgi:hypothetical protein